MRACRTVASLFGACAMASLVGIALVGPLGLPGKRFAGAPVMGPKSVMGPSMDGGCPPGCHMPPTAHGDPMFKVNGTGSHFWLLEDKMTPLLTWPGSPCQKTPCKKTTMTFSGKTFKRAETGHQWFNEFAVSEGETPVFSVAVVGGELQAKFNGKTVQPHVKQATSVRSPERRTVALLSHRSFWVRSSAQVERPAALAAQAGRTGR